MSTPPPPSPRELSEQTLSRTVLQQISDGVFALDREGRFTFVNDFVAQSSGFPAAALRGRTYLELIRPEDRDRVRAKFEETLAGGKVDTYELAYHTAAATEMWVEVNTTPIWQDGEIVGVLGVSRNIQRRKEMERSLRESEERYRSLLEGLPLGVAVLQDERVVLANRAIAEMLRLPSLEGLSLDGLFGFVEPAKHDLMRDRHRRRFAGEQGLPNGYRLPARRTDGSELFVDLHVRTIEHEGRPALQVVAVDVTDRVQLEHHVRQAQKLEAVGTLAGGIAHDFNNVLTAILGMASLLATRFQHNEEVLRIARLIESSADKAAGLTRQLLDFARRDEPTLAPVDVHRTIREVAEILGHSIDKRIEVSLALEAGHAVVRADPSQLEQVLMNLAVNARDAMPEGGRLTIESREVTVEDDAAAHRLELEPGRYLRILVRDTGSGVPQDIADRVFEPFFTTKPRGSGSGMGLAVAYGIVQSHGGAIRLAPWRTNGTTFIVDLPLVQGRQVAETPPKSAKIVGRGRVLVVDDEPMVRDVAAEMLAELGYEVVTAATGRDAIELYRREATSIALVLLDFNMPGMNGTDCFRELVAIDPSTKVVLSSGYGMDPAIRTLLDRGDIAFVDKPYVLARLSEVVAAALGRTVAG